MIATRGAHRRVRLGRRWFLGLPVVALLCSLAFAASAGSAPQGVSVSFNATTTSPFCQFDVMGTWTHVSGQAFLHDQVTDQRTGFSSDITTPISATQESGGVNITTQALDKGKHHYTAILTIEDASNNPLLTGKGGKSLPCHTP